MDSAVKEPEEDPLDQPVEENSERETELETVHQSQEELWKRQIRERNIATCVYSECSISFLTLAGIVAHHKNCIGFASAKDYLTCTMCGLRFKQFKFLKSHQNRAHYAPTTPMGGPIKVNNVQYIPMQQPQYSGVTFNPLN
jgi:hypothetical protein